MYEHTLIFEHDIKILTMIYLLFIVEKDLDFMQVHIQQWRTVVWSWFYASNLLPMQGKPAKAHSFFISFHGETKTNQGT